MIEINNTTSQKINSVKTRKLIEDFLRVYKKSAWEVSIAVIGASRMKRLNNDYRGVDKPTDVLSFGGEEKNDKKSIRKKTSTQKYLGEVIINIEEVKKANKYLEVFGIKKSADYIFYFLLIHGLLHLVGYNDEKEADRLKMLSLGEGFLEEWL